MKPMTRKLDPELQALLAKKNVHRIGRGIKFTGGRSTGEVAWIISVTQKMPIAELATEDLIPPTFKGLPTDVIYRGMTKLKWAKTKTKARTDDWRPAPGGVSIGHYKVSAGTLGVVVYKNGQPRILTNNHVGANCNDAELGDPWLQRAQYDGGQILEQTIARLDDFVPFVFKEGGACFFANTYAGFGNFLAKLFGRHHRVRVAREAEANLVDCAIAKPDRAMDVTNKILEIGTIRGSIEPRLGMEVKKSGRTTGLTKGTIREVDVTADVNMGDGRMATFTDCFSTEDISDPGDSGSLAVGGKDKAVGLLFAGSDYSTIYCKFSNVRKALGLDD